MRVYRTSKGILLQNNHEFMRCDADWEKLTLSEDVYGDCKELWKTAQPVEDSQTILSESLLPPIAQQEVWASGVTYLRSKSARMEESKEAGGGTFYDKVYDAERPELFFKSASYRVVGQGGEVRIRKDSHWNVPEPELTLLVSPSGKITAYTIGNDMSSRDIEGENPLYLPQAKSYRGSTALGPCLYVSNEPLPLDTEIHLKIERDGQMVFQDTTALSQMKRTLPELVGYLFREMDFPFGVFLMTGTGIIPHNDFSLAIGDLVTITIPPIGSLTNRVGN